MIVLFTSNSNPSGILQFVFSFALVLEKKRVEFKVFVPSDAVFSASNSLSSKICKYEKKKSLFTHCKSNLLVANMIKELNPSAIVFFDDGIVSSQISALLRNSTISLIPIIHDFEPHPSNNRTFIRKMHDTFEMHLSLKMQNSAKHIILLSPIMRDKYRNQYPNNYHKTVLFNLGAHLPETSEARPKELLIDDYILFFGRIDKYKGLKNFLIPFLREEKHTLVIGGSGILQPDEKILIEKCGNRIILINRYISDGEMLYLFKHSRCVVLPYIEASQSGVIPIAYYYGKPVIVSCVEGLTQFVTNNETGIICNTDEDYLDAINTLYSPNYYRFSQKCIEYYFKNLDFEENIGNLIKEIY